MYPSYSPLFTLGLLAEHTPTSSLSPAEPDDASFILGTPDRNTAEQRSFLYLDLADNKPPSHRRRHPTLTKSTSWTCSADAYDVARTERPIMTASSLTPVVTTRRRTSKESLRSIPSPKPAPSATLPDPPTVSPVRPASPPLSKKRPVSTVVSVPPSPAPRLRRPVSLDSESISSHDRRKSRMDALACLEGRSRAPHRIPRFSSLRNNFMSFSDDEDERSTRRRLTVPTMPVTPVEDQSAFADVEDEVDAIIVPTVVRRRSASAQSKPVRSAKPARKRRGTIDSWFPLKSFIDLKDDDMSSWNWRSFIEIGGVA